MLIALLTAQRAFIETNIVGTFRMLNAALDYWRELPRVCQVGIPVSPHFDG